MTFHGVKVTDITELEGGIGDMSQTEEFISCLIDVVQDFLSARKVDLKNDEPTKDGWPDPSLIHGLDYDTLHDDFLQTMEMWGFVLD